MYRLYDLLDYESLPQARIGEYETESALYNGAQEYIEDTDGECLLFYIKADEDGKFRGKNLVWL